MLVVWRDLSVHASEHHRRACPDAGGGDVSHGAQRCSGEPQRRRLTHGRQSSKTRSINALPPRSPPARERDERTDDPCTNHPDAVRNTRATLDAIVRELLTPIGVERCQKAERNAPMRTHVRRRHDAHVRANGVCTEHRAVFDAIAGGTTDARRLPHARGRRRSSARAAGTVDRGPASGERRRNSAGSRARRFARLRHWSSTSAGSCISMTSRWTPCVDLDRHFAGRVGDISEYIGRHGNDAYARENVRLL
jgi:hypothetical protein